MTDNSGEIDTVLAPLDVGTDSSVTHRGSRLVCEYDGRLYPVFVEGEFLVAWDEGSGTSSYLQCDGDYVANTQGAQVCLRAVGEDWHVVQRDGEAAALISAGVAGDGWEGHSGWAEGGSGSVAQGDAAVGGQDIAWVDQAQPELEAAPGGQEQFSEEDLASVLAYLEAVDDIFTADDAEMSPEQSAKLKAALFEYKDVLDIRVEEEPGTIDHVFREGGEGIKDFSIEQG
ncbi:hypothetical protein ACFYPT_38960 [Streptomyces sp. NPDC005529]|uniref:hypothetical protein n=1 Tax=unclassified Streptomyces TaxID=2593676 RepID=UPI0033A15F71